MAFFDRNGKRTSFAFGNPAYSGAFNKRNFVPGPKPVTRNVPAPKSTASTTAGTDNALAQLQSSLALEKERKLENT